MARGNGQLSNLLQFGVGGVFFPGTFFSVVALDEMSE